ncbi:MAG: TatD family hydrolase [Chitinophagales bacterium]
MLELIDTHCHLYLDEFAADRDAMIERATQAGVSRFYLPSIDSENFPSILAMEESYPGKCHAMAGLHPCSVKANYKEELAYFLQFMSSRSFSAVGEIGLDFYWDRTFENQQYEAFREQIAWARHFRKPIVIHSRESMQQSIAVVREEQKGELSGIFHCFGDSLESAKEIIGLGFKLGIGGVLTYKNSKLPAVLREIDLEHIVLETDAPYLTPVPFRGKRNESAYLVYILSKLAEIKQLSPQEVARITTQNALNIFGS